MTEYDAVVDTFSFWFSSKITMVLQYLRAILAINIQHNAIDGKFNSHTLHYYLLLSTKVRKSYESWDYVP